MATTKTANAPTFESVWALIQENAQKNALEMEKSRKEMQEIREIQKETDRKISKLGNRIGDIVEHIVAPNLQDKFRKLGLKFEQLNRNTTFYDSNGKTLFELDALLENGDKALLVEVKTTPATEDVTTHIERLGKMRVYADSHGDKRVFLGAVAGVVITDEVRKYVLNHGLYLIEPSGETFNIIPPNGEPKEW